MPIEAITPTYIETDTEYANRVSKLNMKGMNEVTDISEIRDVIDEAEAKESELRETIETYESQAQVIEEKNDAIETLINELDDLLIPLNNIKELYENLEMGRVRGIIDELTGLQEEAYSNQMEGV